MKVVTLKRVYIASPYRGSREVNIRYLKMAMLDSLARNEAPYAPHAYLPFMLDDDKPIERAKGLAIGLAFLGTCSLMALYADHGISEGMQGEMDYAKSRKIPIEIRRIE
jgi:hypothetical protein